MGTFRFKSDLRNHQAIVQPRLYDSLMVTQITLRASPVEMKFEKRMKIHDVVVKFADILNHPAHLLALVGRSGGYLYPYQTVQQCVQPGDRLIIQEISGVWRQQGTMIVRPEHASAAQDAIPGHEELRRSSGEPRMPF